MDAKEAAEIHNDKDEIGFIDFKRVVTIILTYSRQIFQELCKRDPSLHTIESAGITSQIFKYGSAGNKINGNTLHSVTEEEQIAFSGWIERKLINCSAPKTIDLRALNQQDSLTTFEKHENITLGLNSARAIGCNVVNIGAGDIIDGTKHLILGLLWQIIKVGLLKQINVVAHAELATLLEGDETISKFAQLSPEEILIRWVNFQLQGTDSEARMKNFSQDIRNCEIYAYLFEKVAPQEKKNYMHSTRAILDAVDLVQRAEMILHNAELLDCRVFLRPQDIINGSQRLNLAFLANLFHGYPALEKPEDIEEKVAEIEETREEKTYRNWINSMGLCPQVNYLFGDLTNGLILLKLFDLIWPKLVEWDTVNTKICDAIARAKFQRLENCNQAVSLGRQCGFSLVGVGGSDLCQGHPLMTLALLWQLMRAYTLAMLGRLAVKCTATKVVGTNNNNKAESHPPIDDDVIVGWVNATLARSAKRSRIEPRLGFSDPSLATAQTVIDLIDCIRPYLVDYSTVLPGVNDEERMTNAQYAIGLARRIGAKVYAVPEDLVELKSKMILTIFACLMSIGLEKFPLPIEPDFQSHLHRNTSLNRSDSKQLQHKSSFSPGRGRKQYSTDITNNTSCSIKQTPSWKATTIVEPIPNSESNTGTRMSEPIFQATLKRTQPSTQASTDSLCDSNEYVQNDEDDQFNGGMQHRFTVQGTGRRNRFLSPEGIRSCGDSVTYRPKPCPLAFSYLGNKGLNNSTPSIDSVGKPVRYTAKRHHTQPTTGSNVTSQYGHNQTEYKPLAGKEDLIRSPYRTHGGGRLFLATEFRK